MAKINWDLSKVKAESTSLFSKVPAGEYLVSIAHCVYKEKNSDSSYLQVGYMIEDGDHRGKMIMDILNMRNPSEKAVDMGEARGRLIAELQGSADFKYREDKDLINRKQFKIITDLETSTYQDKEVENVKVKKLLKSDDSAPVKTETKKASAPVAEMAKESKAPMPWD
jgi:hypothetical protein